jgi:hypothetical protein
MGGDTGRTVRPPCPADFAGHGIVRMISTLRSLVLRRPRLAALLVLCCLTGAADAETVYVVNETPIPVVVQGTVIINRVPRNDRQILLKSGETTNPGIVLPGTKIITVTDPKNANLVLFRGPIPGSDADQLYVIVPDGPNRVRLERKR